MIISDIMEIICDLCLGTFGKRVALNAEVDGLIVLYNSKVKKLVHLHRACARKFKSIMDAVEHVDGVRPHCGCGGELLTSKSFIIFDHNKCTVIEMTCVDCRSKTRKNAESILGTKLSARCAGCDQFFDKVKKCSVCKLSNYCSRECQKKDWKTHKLTCCK
jgi:hypothetical protein